MEISFKELFENYLSVSGLNVPAFAKKIGIDKQAIYKWISEDKEGRTSPTHTSLERAFNADPSFKKFYLEQTSQHITYDVEEPIDDYLPPNLLKLIEELEGEIKAIRRELQKREAMLKIMELCKNGKLREKKKSH